MKTCISVFLHELRKVLSDRKQLSSIFLMPVFIVFLTSFMSAGVTQENTDRQVYHIYALNNVLPQQKAGDGIEIVPVDALSLDELTNSVALQPEDVVLELTDTHATIYFNSTNAASQNISVTCRQWITDSFLADFARANMVDISSRISITDVNKKADARSSMTAVLFPYMLVVLLFQSTSEYAVDAIAGEKERGVFGKLLLTPVLPAPVISGKLLSSTVCGMLSTGVYLLVVIGSSRITGNDTFGLLEANITPLMILLLAVSALMLSCFFAGLSILCSLYARTVKEAQSMKLPVYCVTMVLALAAMLRVGTVPHIHYFIPIYNICIVMQDILASSAEVGKIWITVLSVSLCFFAVSVTTVFSFNRESIRY